MRHERELCAGNVGRAALPERNWNHTSTSCRHHPLQGCSYKSQPRSSSPLQPPPCYPSPPLLTPEELNKNRRNASLPCFSELKKGRGLEGGGQNTQRMNRVPLVTSHQAPGDSYHCGSLDLGHAVGCRAPGCWGGNPTVPAAAGDPRSNCPFPEPLFPVPSQEIPSWLMKIWPPSRETPKLAQKKKHTQITIPWIAVLTLKTKNESQLQTWSFYAGTDPTLYTGRSWTWYLRLTIIWINSLNFFPFILYTKTARQTLSLTHAIDIPALNTAPARKTSPSSGPSASKKTLHGKQKVLIHL